VTGSPTTVMIAALPDSGLEAVALRSVLEASGHRVDLRFIATPKQFRQVIAAVPAPELLTICGHGAAGGLHFGSLVTSAGGHELVDGVLMPERFAGDVTLPDCTVLCTACDSGSAALARTFLEGGAKAYIAPAGEPEGGDVLVAAHLVLHGLLSGRDPETAMAAANAAVAGALSLTLHPREAHAA